MKRYEVRFAVTTIYRTIVMAGSEAEAERLAIELSGFDPDTCRRTDRLRLENLRLDSDVITEVWTPKEIKL